MVAAESGTKQVVEPLLQCWPTPRDPAAGCIARPRRERSCPERSVLSACSFGTAILSPKMSSSWLSIRVPYFTVASSNLCSSDRYLVALLYLRVATSVAPRSLS